MASAYHAAKTTRATAHAARPRRRPRPNGWGRPSHCVGNVAAWERMGIVRTGLELSIGHRRKVASPLQGREGLAVTRRAQEIRAKMPRRASAIRRPCDEVSLDEVERIVI